MTLNTADQRQGRRYFLSWPVGFKGGNGITRDMSTSGVCFETKQLIDLGSYIHFFIFPRQIAGAPERLDCEGHVVRVAPSAEGYGISVSLTATRLEF
ncbi:MAG: PilZ domain-containing protein [Methylobacter sp.]|nr:PilZ domain-containing protein [Methylobacter sp.]MDP2100018.1 PilZ domain-containing protein [Methylobacter sp.]MDP2427983.1 PilZ domain-containing protein [Methylobacter sp.]MDP3055828.1 PilZ domain-containing protein [Methylobacter sp.]MDP3363491.1 PilZ domain-containing protein [Methylobacter sp.]